MAISTKFSVAVHILSVIDAFPDTPMTSDIIAGSIQTNPVVVRRMMAKLKSAGLLNSKRGSGQTSLAKPATAITLCDIYRAVEGKNALFHIHDDPNPNCPIGATIQPVLNHHLLAAAQAMEASLAQVTLKSVITTMLAPVIEGNTT